MTTFLRVFEAGLAVLALLVTHQLFWVLSSDLQKVLRCPNPPVLAMPAVPGSAAKGGPCGAWTADALEVSEPSLRVTGYAADRTVVQLWANANAVGRAFPYDGRFAADIPLRRGFNRLEAGVVDLDRRDGPPRRHAFAHVNYRPLSPLPARIVGFIPLGGDELSVIGLGEPSSVAWVVVGAGRPRQVFTDSVGTFAYRAPRRAGEVVEVRAASSEETLASAMPVVWGMAEPQLSVSRQVAVEVHNDGRYEMTFRASIPDDTAVWQYAAAGQLTAREFVRSIFGLDVVTPSGPPASDERPRIPAGEPGVVQFVVHGEPGGSTAPLEVYPIFATFRPLATSTDEIRLTVAGDVATTVGQPPSEISDGVRIWRGPYPWSGRDRELFSIGARRRPAGSSPRSEPVAANFLQFTRQLQERVWEVPARLASALLSAIPFIALLWILRPGGAAPPSAYVVDLRALTLAFLLFHLAVLSWPVFRLAFDRLRALLINVAAVSQRGEAAATLRDVSEIAPFLAIGVMLLIRPLYRAARAPAVTTGAPFWLWNVARFVILWPAAVVVPLLLFRELVTIRGILQRVRATGPLPWAEAAMPLLILGSGVLVAWIFLYWFVRVGLRVAVAVKAAVVTSLAMIVLPVVPWALDSLAGLVRHWLARGGVVSPLLLPPELEGGVSLVIVVAVGAALLYQLTAISVQLFTGATGLPAGRWPALALIAVLALLSLPYKVVFGSIDVRVGDLTNLAYAIDRLLPYALLPGIVLFLRKANPTDSFAVGPDVRHAGALMFAFFLAGRTANLLFVPIPLLLGWYTFVRWLTAGAGAAAPPTTARRELIARLLEYRRLHALVDDLRKGLAKKYADGTVTLTEYRMKLSEGERHVAQAAGALAGQVATTKDRIFGRGPGEGPWENARIAMGVGAILSVPFQLVTLTNAFERAPGAYPLLRLTEALLFSTGTWLVIACLFGYFFHLIPGRAGVEKAWIFAGVLVLVTIPAALLQPGAPPAQQQVAQLLPIAAVVPWLAHVLVLTFVLVLALMLDIRTIQASGYSWRDLIAVHGLTTIGAYASSIVVASAASIKGWDVLKAIWDFIQKSGRPGPS